MAYCIGGTEAADLSGDPTGIPGMNQTSQSAYRARPSTSTTMQAAMSRVAMAKEFLAEHDDGGNSLGTIRPHPTLRLAHVQHTIPSGVGTQQTFPIKTSVEKSKYHQAVSRSTNDRFEEQLAKSFAVPLTRMSIQPSRDEAQPRRTSLAATHPNNYMQTTVSPAKPPTKAPLSYMQSDKRTSPSSKPNSSSASLNSNQPATEPSWRVYTDPKWQTSRDPPSWEINRLILKSDTNIEHSGNINSPTFMIGLPFGGMIEMANAYPAAEADSN